MADTDKVKQRVVVKVPVRVGSGQMGMRLEADEPPKHKRNLDDYHRDFLGGRNCTRITIPILSQEQIERASTVLRQLANELDECAHQSGPLLGKILLARNICGDASRRLKGGVAYKGAR